MSREDLHAANQRPDVERIVATRGLELVKTYEETGSAAKNRPVYDRMMEDAHRGMFDVLVVWALDRFGRSMVGNLGAVLALDKAGVQLVSVREAWLDTSGPVRPLLIAIFSWVAEQERARLIERTHAGLARARAKGVKLGRPEKSVDVREARQLLAGGLSTRQAAKRLRVSPTTLRNVLRRFASARLPEEGASTNGSSEPTP